MKFRINWVVTSLAVYIAGLVLYVLRDDNREFWISYYWLLNSYLVIVGMWIALKGLHTVSEKVIVCFILLSRCLLTLYYIICLLWVHNQTKMEAHIAFWIALMVAGFLSVVLRKRYVYGK